jgi:hypothetical protein
MAAFWAVFTFGGSGPDITAHGSLDLKQEIQIQIQIQSLSSLRATVMVTTLVSNSLMVLSIWNSVHVLKWRSACVQSNND